MNDEQLLRYNRQIMLPDIDIEGQQKLLDARVLIIGMGGLGSPAAMYLASAGVGHLVIADHDVVEISNLQRQIAHTEADINRPKVASARDTLLSINPQIKVTALHTRLSGSSLEAEVETAGVVVDASDNFDTRFAVNQACVHTGTPLVSGAAIRMEGQVAVFQPALADSPCYRCLYKQTDEPEQTCSESGVLAPLTGVIGSIQALETIKLITGLSTTLTGRLLLLDGKTMEWRNLKLAQDPLCPVCGAGNSEE